ncbi:MAG TPA: hypothetical protein VHE37_12075 [Nevskiaceae bacterium]|nr:hypothetical protein [Nevskiaceae bacterium]
MSAAPLHTPEPWPDSASADYARQRLCQLQEFAHQQVGMQHSCDCCCGHGGFWRDKNSRYGGTFAEGYRNDGAAIQWLEIAARACAGMPDPAAEIERLLGEHHTASGAYALLEHEAEALRASNAELLAALKDARETIRTWHGPVAWEIYDKESPEMKRLNSAIAKAEGRA